MSGDPPAEPTERPAPAVTEADDLEIEPRPRTARLAGVALGILTVIALVILAAIGFRPALYLLVLAVVGVAMIAAGARMH